MDFKVIWAPSARLDLKEIVSYIAEDNAEIAQRFGLSLIDATKSLASFPGKGRAVPELARISGTRRSRKGSAARRT